MAQARHCDDVESLIDVALTWTSTFPEGRALTGATAEVVQELRNAGGYQGIPIPLAALETRAGETVAADQVNPKAIRPVIDRLFPGSVAERLGIQRINIAPGEMAFPVATAGAVFGWQTTELGNVGGPSEYPRSAGNLTVIDGDEALMIEAQIDAGTSWSRDFLAAHAAGLIRGLSPGFRVSPGGERIERRGSGILRTIASADLFEVSAVTRPAYPEAQIEARSWQPVGEVAERIVMQHLKRWRL